MVPTAAGQGLLWATRDGGKPRLFSHTRGAWTDQKDEWIY